MSKSMTIECCDKADTTNGGDSKHRLKEIKIKFSHKLIVFAGAVLALSWFFEGCRKVQESFSVPHLAILLIGTLLTILFMGIYSYWIYLEEKLKGTLKKRIELFEKIHVFLIKRNDHYSDVVAVGKGDGRG